MGYTAIAVKTAVQLRYRINDNGREKTMNQNEVNRIIDQINALRPDFQRVIIALLLEMEELSRSDETHE